MSKALKALLVKYGATFFLAVIAFVPTGRNSWDWIVAVSITAATLNYLLGDFYLLPRAGNLAASVGNGLLAALAAYVAGNMLPASSAGAGSLALFALLIAVEEYIFHMYLLRNKNVAP